MTDSFRFRATDVGLPTQKIIFETDGNPNQEFAIPDLTVPEDQTERFWFLYNKLVELGAISNRTPTFTPS
jgi:hypothetical protein